jgi:hypothetical protein
MRVSQHHWLSLFRFQVIYYNDKSTEYERFKVQNPHYSLYEKND